MEKLKVGQKVAGQMIASLNKIGERVESGAYRRMDEANKALTALQSQQEMLSKIAKRFNEIESAAQAETAAGGTAKVDTAELLNDLNTAGSFDKLIDQINEAGNNYQLVPLGGFAATVGTAEASFSASVPTWDEFTTSLKIQRWFGVGLSAAFALIGGLIALYYPNATWGASTSDYITLAVWALSVNVIAGQSFDFKAQLKPQITP